MLLLKLRVCIPYFDYIGFCPLFFRGLSPICVHIIIFNWRMFSSCIYVCASWKPAPEDPGAVRRISANSPNLRNARTLLSFLKLSPEKKKPKRTLLNLSPFFFSPSVFLARIKLLSSPKVLRSDQRRRIQQYVLMKRYAGLINSTRVAVSPQRRYPRDDTRGCSYDSFI